MSNEKEIRKLFIKKFKEEFPDYKIKEEFTGGIMKTRCDISCFSKTNIIMVEIKSDKDNLSRLESQIVDYDRYADNIVLIIDEKHKESIKELKEKSPFLKFINFNILIYKKNDLYYMSNEKFKKFGEYRFKNFNNIVHKNIYSLLWSDEKKQLINFIKGRTKFNKDNIIKTIYSIEELEKLTKEILYTRKNNEAGHILSNISNKELKQIIFNERFKK